jgi:hypothetical protein
VPTICVANDLCTTTLATVVDEERARGAAGLLGCDETIRGYRGWDMRVMLFPTSVIDAVAQGNILAVARGAGVDGPRRLAELRLGRCPRDA